MTTRKSAALQDRMRAASAAGLRRSTAPAAADDPSDEPEPVSVPRTRPVKVTVELQPIEHRRLKQWCTEVAVDLNLTVVAGAEVLRVLWQLAQEDPALANRVRAELKRTGGSRRRG